MQSRPAARSAAQLAPAARGASSQASSPDCSGPACDPFLLLDLHGHGVELTVHVPAVARAAAAILGPLVDPFLPEAEVRGSVLPFTDRVVRQLSGDAVRIDEPDLLLELYREPRGERLWVIDERWGICEINLLRRSWKSWVLPAPAIDAVRLFEAAVMWPMAQVLRASGLHVIPAAAVGKGGRGVLILSPFDVGPELEALASAGVGIIGQRWTALRSENGRISLLAMPGRIEHAPRPRLLSWGPMQPSAWMDLGTVRSCHQAGCELVLLVEPMRRTVASVTPLSQTEARNQLKLLWPIPQLSAGSSTTVPNLFPATLARSCAVRRLRLSRDGADLARMLMESSAAAA